VHWHYVAQYERLQLYLGFAKLLALDALMEFD
jgi:hypothetical protein